MVISNIEFYNMLMEVEIMNQYVTGAVIQCHGVTLSPAEAEKTDENHIILIERKCRSQI